MSIIQKILEIKDRYASPFEMHRDGIMGMNQRNVSYIGKYNKRSLYPLVDNKLLTKKIALENNVKTPVLIGSVQNQQDLSNILDIIIKTSGQEITMHELRRHVNNILAGLFSLGGKQDIALIEDLIHFDDVFSGYSYDGVPDTRVIVFQGFPVMCMMRLSTAASDGKANLHQGAVGVGICVRTGRAVRAVQHNEPIETHPDTEKQLSLLKVPHWQEVLELASSCYDMSGLGYIGTDIVLDRDRGPMLLELNARPGMAIQICNNTGLLPRLRLIEAMTKKHRLSVKERVAFSMNHFGVFKD